MNELRLTKVNNGCCIVAYFWMILWSNSKAKDQSERSTQLISRSTVILQDKAGHFYGASSKDGEYTRLVCL